MSILLMGYMGSGKSTIGHLLSKDLGLNFVDFDDYIEEKQQTSIARIFKEKGEIYFRKLEREALIEILDENKTGIISLGGGTPCYGDNIKLIRDSGATTVYINVPVTELAARLWKARGHRPLLEHQDTIEKLEEFVRKHLFERSFYYNQAAIKISAQGKSELELMHELKSRLDFLE